MQGITWLDALSYNHGFSDRAFSPNMFLFWILSQPRFDVSSVRCLSFPQKHNWHHSVSLILYDFFSFSWAYRHYCEVMAFFSRSPRQNFRAVKHDWTQRIFMCSISVPGCWKFSLCITALLLNFCYWNLTSLSVEPQKQGSKANFSTYIRKRFHTFILVMLRIFNRLNCNSIWFPNCHRSEMKLSFSRI